MHSARSCIRNRNIVGKKFWIETVGQTILRLIKPFCDLLFNFKDTENNVRPKVLFVFSEPCVCDFSETVLSFWLKKDYQSYKF